MAFGDDLVLFEELLSRLLEGFFVPFEKPGLRLAAKPKIPAFGRLLGEGKVILACGRAILASLKGRGTVPSPRL